MQVDEYHIVTLCYKLRETDQDGELLEVMDARYPFIFLYGSGKLLPAFEIQIKGLEKRALFSFTLTPEQGYGYRNPWQVVTVDKNTMENPEADFYNMGGYVALTDNLGTTHHGKIIKVDEHTIDVDLNHAMAGKTLYFQGMILDIRQATLEELIQKRYIPEGHV